MSHQFIEDTEQVPRVETIRPEGSLASPPAEPVQDKVLDVETEDAQPREVREFQKLREDMGVTDHIDPLQALLEAPIGPPTDQWHCSRLKTKFEIRALKPDEYNEIQDRATRWTRNKRSGRMERDLDGNTMSLLVCVHGTTAPNFAERNLTDRYGVREPHRVVAKALLPGEIDSLAEKILSLSGFDQDLEDQGKD